MIRRREYFWGLFGSFLVVVGLGVAGVRAAEGETQVVVNAVPLTAETVQGLQRIYPVPIQPGRYWYDAFSGAGGQSRGGGGGGSSTRTFCDPDGSCRSSGLWGSILTVPR